MKSPAAPSHRSFIAGMLASALSITSWLKRHNWRRGGSPTDRARRGRYAQRKLSQGHAAASGNPVILLVLLTLLAVLANRETLPFGALGCVGMYSVTNLQSRSPSAACYAATNRRITAIETVVEGEFVIIADAFLDRYFDDGAEATFEGEAEPTSDDLF